MTDIAERLRIKADMILMCEKIKFGSDAAVMQDAAVEIERLRALLKEVDDWVRDLEPFADAGHEPVTVFKKVRAALAEEKHDE
jgi:hypothetical protein